VGRPEQPRLASQSLDESAVSICQDNGQSWNQTGLIDTMIDRFRSVATAEDESTLYLASVNDTGFDSLWRSQSSILGAVWQRVMCFNGESSILRLAPDIKDGAAIFWGDKALRWRATPQIAANLAGLPPNVIIQDLAAADNRTLYILQANGDVRRGSYISAWQWDRSIDSGLDTGHTISVHGENILVGSAKGTSSPAAYSVDGGRLWTKVINQTPSSGNRHAHLTTTLTKIRSYTWLMTVAVSIDGQ